MGGSLVALQSFGHLKIGTKTFNFRVNEPSPDILVPLFRYDNPLEERPNRKKAMQNPCKTHADRSLNPLH